LQVPSGSGGRPVCCRNCRALFRLPAPASVIEEKVAAWLSDERDAEHPAAAPAGDTAPPTAGVVAGPAARVQAASGDIRLVGVGRKGALFEFPADRLLDPSFRCSMPRRCLRCGSRAHLTGHVIIYAPQLTDSLSLEAAHSAGDLVLGEVEARTLSSQELLDRLPRVPNVPHPADLAMPYWLCRMCGDAGAVSGKISVNTETGRGFCRLLMCNLEMAEEFMVAAGGEGSPGHARLRQVIKAEAENPWEVLPSSVRHRLEQWFLPKEGERFIGYVPDRDHAQAEDGVAGLVVSDHRLIWRMDRRCREADVTALLTVELVAEESGKGRLNLATPSWHIKRLGVDGDGMNRLRRALSAGRFRVLWR